MILLSLGCEETGRGKTSALDETEMNERGKTAALKMKTPRSYSEVPRLGLAITKDAAKTPRLRPCELILYNPDRPCPIPIKIPETTWPPVPELLAQPENANTTKIDSAIQT